MIFVTGGLSWIFETERDPSESNFYSVYGHMSNGTLAMPGRYLKFEVARRPSTSPTGTDRVKPTCNRALFDKEVHRSAPGRRSAGFTVGHCGAVGFSYITLNEGRQCSGRRRRRRRAINKDECGRPNGRFSRLIHVFMPNILKLIRTGIGRQNSSHI